MENLSEIKVSESLQKYLELQFKEMLEDIPKLKQKRTKEGPKIKLQRQLEAEKFKRNRSQDFNALERLNVRGYVNAKQYKEIKAEIEAKTQETSDSYLLGKEHIDFNLFVLTCLFLLTKATMIGHLPV